MTDNRGMRRYSQLAAMSQRRREELAEAGTLVPGSTFARGRVKPQPRPAPSTGPDRATQKLILARSLRPGSPWPRCEVCSRVLDGEWCWQWAIHHRRGREGERTDNRPTNLVLCCGVGNEDLKTCHGQIHQRRSWSQPLGLWLPRNGIRTDPALVPVTIDRGSRVVYLDAVGGYSDNPPGVLAAVGAS